MSPSGQLASVCFWTCSVLRWLGRLGGISSPFVLTSFYDIPYYTHHHLVLINDTPEYPSYTSLMMIPQLLCTKLPPLLDTKISNYLQTVISTLLMYLGQTALQHLLLLIYAFLEEAFLSCRSICSVATACLFSAYAWCFENHFYG